ncbi:MAG: uracil-DNA glycosylase [Clostridiaceae bacterium BRH_c20a]|nr:MAG: uracil-DNA glycosylase [Clostridiaceae bacterium BRH_c20a]
MNNRVNCLKCQFFYITWEKKFPRGCKAHGFKTAQNPSTLVLRSSGTKCLYFKQKENNV